MARLALDEAKPGSKLKNRREVQLRAALVRGTCTMAGANQSAEWQSICLLRSLLLIHRF
jgi:hypothetical protein